MKALFAMVPGFGGGRRGAVRLDAPTLKHGGPRVPTAAVVEDRLGDEETSMLKKFIMNLINKGFECTTRNIAVLKFMNVLSLYEILYGAEREKEKLSEIPAFLTLFGPYSESSRWGGTVLVSGNPRLNTDDPLSGVSAISFDDEVGDKLVDIASGVIRKCHTSYFFADIKHLVSLQKNFMKIPVTSLLKKNCTNLFLGTVIMKGGEPHVIGAKWNGRFFEIALVCLSTVHHGAKFQFVTIGK